MNNKVQPFFEGVTLFEFKMKKSKQKSKSGRGGARPGAGEVLAGNTGERNWYGCLWHCWMKFWKWRGIWIRTRENYLRRLLL